MYPYCGFCKHAINKKRQKEKINYGNGTYDITYREEIMCEINNSKYHPMEFGCDGKYFKERI
jgi:hypothetical protein